METWQFQPQQSFHQQGAWRRCTPANPCQICGHGSWCSVSPDGGTAVCMRADTSEEFGEGKPTKNDGWSYRIASPSGPRSSARTVVIAPAPDPRAAELVALAAECYDALPDANRAYLGEQLGLTLSSLQRLQVGWHRGLHAYTFPMVGCEGRVVGIRVRRPDGAKFSVAGGHEGLFLPTELPNSGILFITEGPTDCAALLDFGLSAIGRPSCRGAVDKVEGWINVPRVYSDVTIVSDADEPGRLGAAALANRLMLWGSAVRVITPPAGIKDARDWKKAGATAESVLAVHAAAPMYRLTVRYQQTVREQWVGGKWQPIETPGQS